MSERSERGERMMAARVGLGSRVDESTVILGIETSCDETAASLVMGGSDVLSSVVSTSICAFAAATWFAMRRPWSPISFRYCTLSTASWRLLEPRNTSIVEVSSDS